MLAWLFVRNDISKQFNSKEHPSYKKLYPIVVGVTNDLWVL